ncbi:hypothetical protein CR159_01660 [Pollutimonas subterranea]|uniref:TadE-like domain-containing protein n=1 Tax=Pollutimonas subterranea TaxID=2045210 RepID=A0A2N4U9T1_9BURK|nr:TadE family protein [Pollutimonas subterranea]PLC51757.1 hypothetical protein CR159_01660 [Pollutimonas subterranea]
MRLNHVLPRLGPRRPSRAAAFFARPPARQGGTSLIEFSVVAVPIFLLGMGTIEVAQWFFKRQALSLALLEAGRAAITAHARPSTIESAFEKALLPLLASDSGATRTAETRSGKARSESGAVQRLEQALVERRRLTGAAPWRIQILSPTPQAFRDFSDSSLPIAKETGLHAINNNYLAEQSQRASAQGQTPPRGPQSSQDILQANTLVLRLTYLHEPILPGIKGLMRLLGSQGSSYGQNAMARGGYIPIMQDIALVMQSHPVDWPSLGNGKVVKEQLPPSGLPVAVVSCQGLWCMDAPGAPVSDGTAQPSSEDALPQWPPAGNGQTPNAPVAGSVPNSPADSTTPTTPSSGLAVAPDDPACGVILCCTA